jgi:diamine N-acetyltransferase
MKIRRAQISDAAALAALAERTFRDAFAADNTAEDMTEHCAQSYSPDIQRRELSDAAVDTLVCVNDDGELIAYAQLRPGVASAVTGAKPLELWRFYVDRAHHGRGVAQQLMAEVMQTARARDAATLWLGAWERNLRAQAFYRKCGFVDVGSHQFRVGQDVQTDRLMSLTLSSTASTT